MICEDIKFKSSNNEHDIHGHIFFPDSDPKGIFHILHGMREHIGRYREFEEYMVSEGYIVCGCDMAGHGLSTKDNRFGYFSEKDGHITIYNDVVTMHEILKNRFPDMPYILFGHSMGSFLARYFCARYNPNIDAAIFSGTGYANPTALSFASAFARLLIIFNGKEKQSAFLTRLTTDSYNKHFRPNLSPSDWLTRDTEKAEEYNNDKLNQFMFTYPAYRDLFELFKAVSKKSWAKQMNPELPIYIFSGSMDPVGSFSKGVIKVCKMLYSAGNQDVTLKLYEGGRHEMLNEINRSEVYEDVAHWCSSVLEKI